MATRKKKSSKSESLTVAAAPSAETTINILFDQPIKIQAPDLKAFPKASNVSRKKQRLKKSLEQVYQNALYKELCYRVMKVECQKEILVHYKGETVGRYIADMLVENRVILELKAVQALRVEHEWQLINYLKATGLEVGLLLNFGHSAEFKRKVFTK